MGVGEMLPPSRGQKVAAAYGRKLDDAFAGRTFDIVREIHLPKGKAFRTAFGHLGRHGYVIRDRATGAEQVVGLRLLHTIHDRYHGVDLPDRRRRKG